MKRRSRIVMIVALLTILALGMENCNGERRISQSDTEEYQKQAAGAE